MWCCISGHPVASLYIGHYVFHHDVSNLENGQLAK